MIRNAGGVVTDDEIRSLAISQRLLGTEEIILIHHTDCGMLTFRDDDFRRSIQEETGIKPEWAAEAFSDLDEDVRQSIARIKASPFIPRKDEHPRLRLRGRDGPPARSELTRRNPPVCKGLCRREESALIERRPPSRRPFRGAANGGTEAAATAAGANRRLSAA